MTTNETLKPCPFCGSHKIVALRNEHYNDVAVHCKECGASGTACASEIWAITFWNRRMEPEPEAPIGIPASVLRGGDSDE